MFKHELISTNEQSPMKIIFHHHPEATILLHWHQAIEINYVINGQVQYLVDGKQLSVGPNELIVINSNEIHGVHNLNRIFNGQALTLQVSYQFLTSLIPNFNHYWFETIPNSNTQTYPQLLSSLQRIAQSESKTDTVLNYFEQQSAMYDIIYCLLQANCHIRQMPTNLQANSQLAIAQRTIAYLIDHSQEKLDLPSISAALHLSIGYLSRLFKKQLGVSVMHYLQLIRLQNAYQLLMNSQKPIDLIADLVGFPNVKSFRNAFYDTYQTTPLKYRHEVKKWPFFSFKTATM